MKLPMYPGNQLSPEKFQARDIDILSGKMSAAAISRKYDCTITAVLWRANKLNVKFPYGSNRKYTANYNYFSVWSHEMAWFVGYIAADGCVREDGKGVSRILEICLSIKDKKQLENMNKLLDSNYPLYFKKVKAGKKLPRKKFLTEDKEYCRLQISSQKICQDLLNLGITPRKTQTLEWINECPHEFIPSFIRGYIDGDGSISIVRGRDRKPYLSISICGNYDFLNQMNLFTQKYYNIKGSISKGYGNYYQIKYIGLSAKSLCEIVYDDKTEFSYLPRKYDIYINSLNEVTYGFQNKTSQYYGVHKKQNDKWRAQVYLPRLMGQNYNKLVFIGDYQTENEAMIAYNQYIIDNQLNKPLNVIPDHGYSEDDSSNLDNASLVPSQ